jgi:putative transposase
MQIAIRDKNPALTHTRAKKELGYPGEIWQRGFSEVRIYDREGFFYYRRYIYENPVKAGYVKSAEEYPYRSAYFRKKKPAAKARY